MSRRAMALALAGAAAVGGLWLAQALSQPAAGRPRHPLVAALDADKDGEISAGEIQRAPEALKALDRNEDGKLSGEELGPRLGRFRRPGRGRTI